ncbi:MAG: hypothetical protein V9G14_02595 [Cypionkella sp.]
MNKNVIIGLVLILAAGAGYYQFSMKPAQEAAVAQKAADEAAAKAAADTAAAAKAAEDEAAAAAKKVADEAAAAAAATTTATTEAAPAATDAMAVLDPANFDAAKINALIDASTLDDATKGTLKSGVDAAATNPALVEGAISAVKAALGM